MYAVHQCAALIMLIHSFLISVHTKFSILLIDLTNALLDNLHLVLCEMTFIHPSSLSLARCKLILYTSRLHCSPISLHFSLIARQAFKLPTTAAQMTGLTMYESVKNLAIDIFSSSSVPLTSARLTSFVAGGPVGINMSTK